MERKEEWECVMRKGKEAEIDPEIEPEECEPGNWVHRQAKQDTRQERGGVGEGNRKEQSQRD